MPPHLIHGLLAGNRFRDHLGPLRGGVVLHQAPHPWPHKVVVINLWTRQPSTRYHNYQVL
jgi:hypothetical protein